MGLVNCVNMTVEGLDLVSNVDGLMLANTNDSRVAMNTIAGNRYGVYLWGSSNNTLTSNNITSNLCQGIRIDAGGNTAFTPTSSTIVSTLLNSQSPVSVTTDILLV